jgi:hypothetical protein
MVLISSAPDAVFTFSFARTAPGDAADVATGDCAGFAELTGAVWLLLQAPKQIVDTGEQRQ